MKIQNAYRPHCYFFTTNFSQGIVRLYFDFAFGFRHLLLHLMPQLDSINDLKISLSEITLRNKLKTIVACCIFAVTCTHSHVLRPVPTTTTNAMHHYIAFQSVSYHSHALGMGTNITRYVSGLHIWTIETTLSNSKHQ